MDSDIAIYLNETQENNNNKKNKTNEKMKKEELFHIFDDVF